MNGIAAIALSLCLSGGLMAVPPSAAAQATESVPAEADPLRASLPEVKAAILSATRYEAGATKTDLVVTLINSDLSSRTSSARADEAAKIAGIIADSPSGKPAFNNITALHIDYVTREGRHARTVDKVDFRKDPQGRFSHHVS